jgi:hypothetical protein
VRWYRIEVRRERDERSVTPGGEDVIAAGAHRDAQHPPPARGEQLGDKPNDCALAAAGRLDLHQLNGEVYDIRHGLESLRA